MTLKNQFQQVIAMIKVNYEKVIAKMKVLSSQEIKASFKTKFKLLLFKLNRILFLFLIHTNSYEKCVTVHHILKNGCQLGNMYQ